VTQRRMRAVVQEILARRMPAPPAEYLALQIARLNEAMLVSYGSMGGGNLAAVDRVVKITRELDRYHGLAAAAGQADEWRWAEVPAQRALKPPRRPSRLQMAPQVAEIAQLAAGACPSTETAEIQNEPLPDDRISAWVEPVEASTPADRNATKQPFAAAGDPGRLQMAPQAADIAQSAAANGAPPQAVESRNEPLEDGPDSGPTEAAAMAQAVSLSSGNDGGAVDPGRLATARQATEVPQSTAANGAPPM